MHLWAVYFHGIVVWVAMVAQLQFKKETDHSEETIASTEQ